MPRGFAWLQEILPEGFTVFGQVEAQRRRLRTSNACENLNRQVRRRTAVAGLFPNEASLQRLVSAILMDELHKVRADWQEWTVEVTPLGRPAEVLLGERMNPPPGNFSALF